jgi:hypothetical protein
MRIDKLGRGMACRGFETMGRLRRFRRQSYTPGKPPRGHNGYILYGIGGCEQIQQARKKTAISSGGSTIIS